MQWETRNNEMNQVLLILLLVFASQGKSVQLDGYNSDQDPRNDSKPLQAIVPKDESVVVPQKDPLQSSETMVRNRLKIHRMTSQKIPPLLPLPRRKRKSRKAHPTTSYLTRTTKSLGTFRRSLNTLLRAIGPKWPRTKRSI